jgi:hypothetical protein
MRVQQSSRDKVLRAVRDEYRMNAGHRDPAGPGSGLPRPSVVVTQFPASGTIK